jgi:serine O-acetyltransferase
VLKALNFLLFHCVLPVECEIGKDTVLFHHGLGVIIHPNVKIGSGCQIYNHVVIGGGHRGPDGGDIRIEIGNGCTIGVGAKILCKDATLSVGDRAVIGANAVVTTDVPADSIVGGVPAKILSWQSSRDA